MSLRIKTRASCTLEGSLNVALSAGRSSYKAFYDAEYSARFLYTEPPRQPFAGVSQSVSSDTSAGALLQRPRNDPLTVKSSERAREEFGAVFERSGQDTLP